MKGLTKIKAGALQFVLFIGVVIALLLTGFVLITYTHNFFHKQTDTSIALIENTQNAFSYAAGSNNENDLAIPSFNDLNIETTVSKSYWGVYEKYAVLSKFKRQQFTRSALIGKGIESGFKVLYLKDNQRPLVIAGSAKITGDVALPEQGVRMGNISGNSYYRNKLIYGRQNTSRSKLPMLDTGLLTNLDRILEGPDNVENRIQLKKGGAYKNSFQKPTDLIIDHTIVLSDLSLTGNFIVYATHRIVVEPSAYLNEVILVAPEINIKNNVKGSFQAISTNNISVGKNCELTYPSAIVLFENSEKDELKKSDIPLQIGMGSVINGSVLYLGDIEKQRYFPQIKVENEALIRGEIYCKGNLELKGTVLGNVTTNGFLAIENGSIYQNHLYNGVIDGSGLPKEYVGMVVGESITKKVAKWLY
ncbi:hypothetical protein [Cytophaga sp. FL35]|uniref:hypothetical protein n=1 Tax=Cytophaga sp. FL35 TaxID=1904456 RepID=UPI001653C72B|nr:hypothetical protein [Cytophaga sp. FL35]MBC6999637.1 hypothetical protein [Cytophaga sp. FL35]